MEEYDNLIAVLLVVSGLPILAGFVVEKYKRNHTADPLVAGFSFLAGAVFYNLGWIVPLLLSYCVMGTGGVWYLKKTIANKRRGTNTVRRS